jgi:hypothetical protein
MNLRTIIGAILILYGVIGLSILFIPVASAYYEGVVSSFSGNPSLCSFFSLFNPFPSVLENFVWFGLCLFLGIILLAYRRLITREKPSWLRADVSQPKSLG